MALLFFLALGLGLGLGLGSAPASASGFYSDRDGWDWVSSSAIAALNGSEFEDMATPLVQMCANTYRYPRSVAIQGWKASTAVAAIGPSTGGVHAIAYEAEADDDDDDDGEEEEEEPSTVVVAFRGTQISDPLQSLADLCAGMLLWGEYANYSSLPDDCTSSFNESTLAYLDQAIAFTELALQAYPTSGSLLLTGHSLGAGLAILVSKALFDRGSAEIPVIAFSTSGPGGNALFSDKNTSYDVDHVITIALEWDEVVRASWDDQVGLLCLYEEDEPSSCQACFSTTNASSSSLRSATAEENLADTASKYLPQGDCWTCFLETHILKVVINAVAKGEKPVCQFVSSQESNSYKKKKKEEKEEEEEKNRFTTDSNKFSFETKEVGAKLLDEA